jgi:hypothetical protein
MEPLAQSLAHLDSSEKDVQHDSGLFSAESVLNILRMILAGAPSVEVLTIIAQLAESRGDGTLCTMWLPDDDGKQLYCAAAPSLPGFIGDVGSMLIGPKGGSCGTAVYRNLLDTGRLHPASPHGDGIEQLFGDCWEWTASPYTGIRDTSHSQVLWVNTTANLCLGR